MLGGCKNVAVSFAEVGFIFRQRTAWQLVGAQGEVATVRFPVGLVAGIRPTFIAPEFLFRLCLHREG